MFISVRVFFENVDEAIEALLICLEDARTTDKSYSFGSLSYDQIMASGLIIIGDAQHLVDELLTIPGSTLHQE